MDAIARYRAASEQTDLDGLIQTLSPDAELISPLSGRLVFRGHEDLGVLLGAVYGSLRGLRWSEQIGDGETRVVARRPDVIRRSLRQTSARQAASTRSAIRLTE